MGVSPWKLSHVQRDSHWSWLYGPGLLSSGDVEPLSLIITFFERLRRSACSLMTTEARSGSPFEAASRWEVLGVADAIRLILACRSNNYGVGIPP